MSIVLAGLTKRYQGQAVVNDVSLEVADGELCVLLGSSGSGKSTVLRMIAGLAPVDAGRIVLHGRDVTEVPPQKRGVGFVFQHYALFRTMTAGENIEFPLRIRKVPTAERRRRRDELLDLVGLGGLGDRLPRQLSGGQQQRVALARALAQEPEVLLLDEPFGALDARIRADLRLALRQLLTSLKVTALFVTHDQEEAFELADRVAVLDAGRLLEVGSPQELYLRPKTEFVATFLGQANLLVGECSAQGVRVGPVEFPLATAAAPAGEPRRVQVLFRPEDVALAAQPSALGHPCLGEATVLETSFVGARERLRLELPPLPGVRPIAPVTPFGSDAVRVDAERPAPQAQRFPLRPGDRVALGVRRIHALAHPGLGLLLVAEDSAEAQAAVELGGRLGRAAHARTTVLALGREAAAGGTGPVLVPAERGEPTENAVHGETERRPYDLVVVGFDPGRDDDRTEALLASGEHQLLLVPKGAGAELPTRFLIAVAVGEPGKDDVLFAGRLARHLGARATVLAVVEPDEDAEPAERFLAAAVRSLAVLGVAAETAIRRGAVAAEILAATAAEPATLLVVGAPLPDRRGRRSLGGVLGRVLAETRRPVLIVRSPAIPTGLEEVSR
ncbi:MAG: ATP-binding cassette domain-containing protein [Thermoanaerobaculia bacterium]|nr:ATP-binding cassette domain-containing protein [Thermoanaerobaculia bacterium]